MHLRNLFLPLAFAAAALLPIRSAAAQDLASVLQRLDAAARDFHTTAATVEYDNILTDPIPDKDVMTGTAYYERNSHFEMAVHFTAHNGRPMEKGYILSGGTVRLSDTGKEKDAQPINGASKYESYFILGFGASGKDLQEKWTIKYLGKETLGGIATDKLELVAKDPDVRKNIPKVTIWLDTSRAVSLKQVFDQGDGQSRICTYTNIKVNQTLPKTAFSFDK